jgi:predicted ATPase
MTENEIILLHDRLYEYLKGLHEAEPTFGFSTQQEVDLQGFWFGRSTDRLQCFLYDHAHNIPIYNIYFPYNQSYYVCTIHHQVYEGDLNLKKISKSKWTQLNDFLSSLGFSKTDSWRKDFPIEHDFIQSLDSFVKNQLKAIKDFFKKELRLYEKEKDNITSKYIDDIEKEKQFGHVRERYRLLYNPSIPHLPFALSRLEINDFQGIKHAIIDNIPTDAQWIFLTGHNGFGKTSFLRAIAKGLVGEEDLVEPLPEKSQIYANGYNWNEPFFHSVQSRQLSTADFQVVTYGITRFRYHNDPEKNPPKTLALFNDEAPLLNIERILIESHRAKTDGDETETITTFDKLKKIFLSVIPQLSDIKIEYFRNETITNRYQVRYYEKELDGKIYEPIKRNDLAAGYRSILSIIGDMIVRLSAHPNNALDDLQGIVLIDEFDAHLHPKYQYELPKLLSDVFPKVQFIVSTHSPIPILGAKPNTAVVLTVHRTKEAGITVERLDDDIEIGRLSANALLTSDIFNFKTIFARGATPDTIESFDDYDRIKTKNRRDKLLELKRGIN